MSLTIVAAPNPHLRMNPMGKPLHSERRFLSSSEDVLHPGPKLSINPQTPGMLTNLRKPVRLWSESWAEGETGGANMVERKRTSSSSFDKPARINPEDDDGLELSLGLSIGRSSCKSTENLVGKKCWLSCEKPSIGSNDGSLNSHVSKPSLQEEKVPMKGVAERDGSVPEQTLWGNGKGLCLERLHNPVLLHASKQQSVDGPRLTAAQVWHTIQRSSSLPNKMAAPTNTGNGSEALKSATASDVWAQMGQRSASMHPIESRREGGDTISLVRSTSNCVNVKPQQFVDCPPSSLVHQISCTESFQTKSSRIQQDQQQQEMQGLQRKKELQAQKRQEARKRRKNLIEEKQLKRAKREESKFLSRTKSSLTNNNPMLRTSCAPVAMEDTDCSPNRDGGGPQRMGSGKWVQCWETSVPVSMGPGGAVKDSEQVGDHEEQKLPFGFKSEEENPMKAKGDKGDAPQDGETVRDVSSRLVSTVDQMERAEAARLCLPRTHPESITVVQNTLRRPKARWLDEANGTCRTEMDASEGDSVKPSSYEDCESNSSKSESRDDMEEPMLRTQIDLRDHEASSQKSTLESDKSSQTVVSVLLRTPSAVTSTPCTSSSSSSSSLLPMPYPFPMPVPPPPGLPLQMGFSVPYFMQFLAPHSSSGLQDNPNLTRPQMLPPFQFPVRSGFTPYCLPIPWFPVTHSQVTVHPEPGAPSAKRSDGPMEYDRGSSNETEAKDVEMENLSTNSIQGNSSARQTKGEWACFAPLPKRLHGHSSDVSSQTASVQLGLTRTTSDSGAHMGPTCVAIESGEKVLSTERSRGTLVSEATTALEKPRVLPTSQVPAQESARVVPSPCGERKGSSMAAKQSPVHSNTGDAVTSEVCSSSEGNGGSVAAEESLSQEGCNPQSDVAIQGKSEGTGTFPGLHGVSTTGPAPNGRTVTGVMYIFNKNQVKIVCTCHAKHMSPSEFVQHAGHTDLSNPERNILVNPVPYIG